MNSFRVIDTRFRILKGGKIGLSLSISLIGSALVFGNINAYSQTFFDGITDGTTFTSGDVSAREKSDDGDSTDVYNTISLTESIVFRPQRVVSSYVGVADYEVFDVSPNQSSVFQNSDGTVTGTFNSIVDGNYTYTDEDGTHSGTNNDRAYYQIFTPSTNFTVTLDTNSTVNNIIKDNSEYYSVNSSTGYDIQNTSYTANVVFTGSNRVYGSTNIGDGNIKLDGSVIFSGTVDAGSIDMDTTNTATFTGDVSLSSGAGNLNFAQNGNIILNSNFSGNITNTNSGDGNITTIGTNYINGNIGNSSNTLNSLNIGDSTTISTTTVNGEVFVNSTVLNNTSAANSTLIMQNDKNITSIITTNIDGKGILTLNGGTQTVTGEVGTTTKKLKEINAGVDGSISTFKDNVYAINITNTGNGDTIFEKEVESQTLNVNNGTTTLKDVAKITNTNIGSGTLNIEGNYTGTEIRFNADGEINVNNDSNITSNIVTSNNSQGTLTLNGNSVIDGQIGNTNKLKEINAATDSKIVTFNKNVNSDKLNFVGDGTVKVSDNVEINSTIETNNIDKGTLTLDGNSTIKGRVGTSSNRLKEINAGVTSKEVNFEKDIYSNDLNITGIGTANLNTISGNTTTNINFQNSGNVNLNGNLIGNILTLSDNQGTFTIVGDTLGKTQTIEGNIGSSETSDINLLNIGEGSTKYSTTIIRGNVFANNTILNNTTINDSTLILDNNSNIFSTITTNIDGKGILTLNGGTQTVTGEVGTTTKKLKEINAGVDGSISTFKDNVYAINITNTGNGDTIFEKEVESQTLNVNNGTTTLKDVAKITNTNIGSGTLNIEGNYTGTEIRFNADGEINVNNDSNITSNIVTSNNSQGTLTLNGNSVIDGQIGNTNKLKEINAGATGSDSTFNSDVFATNLDVEGTGTVNLEGNYKGTSIRYNADGTVVLADGSDVNSSIINNSGVDSTGTLTLNGSSTVSGNVGADGASLKEINAGANGSDSTFSSDVFATNLDVEGTGRVNLNGDYKGTSIRYNADGTVVLSDGSDVNSSIINNSGVDSTGTLTLNGSSTVSGNVGADGASLKEINAGANGSDSTFSSDVFATTTNVGAGEIKFEGNLTGNIDAITSNQGTITFVGDNSGKAQLVTGNIGIFGDSINVLNIGESGSLINYSTTTVNGDVFANSTVLNNTITNSSTLILSNDKNITSTITTSHDNKGILTLSGGTQTVTGQIGTDTLKLAEVNAGANGSDSTFSSDVFATNLDVEGTGRVNLNGDYKGTSIRYNADGTVVLADGSDVNSAITTGTTNTGTLTLNGSSTVSGNVGADGASLKEINAGATGSDSTFNSDVFATNLDVEGTGRVNLNGDYKGTSIRYNADGTVVLADGSDVNSSIINNSGVDSTGTLTLNGSSTVSGNVGADGASLKEINAGATGSDSTFNSDVFATNLDVEGTGRVNLNGDYKGTSIRYNADGTVVLADGSDVNSSIINNSGVDSTGTLTLNGSSTVSGNVGADGASLKEINAGANGSDSTFTGDVFATTTNVGAGEIKFEGNLTGNIDAITSNQGTITFVGDNSGKAQLVTGNIGIFGDSINVLNIGESGSLINYSTTTVNGDVFANSTVLNNTITNSSTLILSNDKNITSTITTSHDNKGILTLSGGTQIVTGQIGTDTLKLAEVNAGATGSDSTFSSDVFATNLDVEGTGRVNLNGDYKGTSIRYNADGTVVLADNKNIDSSIINNSSTTPTGTLTLEGSSIVSGTVGTDANRLKEINAGATGSDSTFSSDVFATTTNITSGVVNFNTISGTTTTNIVFSGNGTANLNQGLTGNIYFAGNDANINVSDGKGILGSVETLANNTGILNFKGDGVINGIIGSADFAIKELNVNSENEQDKDGNGTVITQGLLAHREIFAEIINLRNNATLTLANNANITKTSTGLVISTDSANSGNVVFLGSSTVTGEVGTNSNNLESITAGANNHTVTFNDMVYASIINYSDDGKVVLNGDNSLNPNAEGFKGTVNFDSFAGKLEIGDDVNLTIGTAGTQFVNANNATLTFNGTSTIYGTLGGNTAGNSTFESIYAGVTGKEVTFKNDVYVKESTFHISEDGIVNFEGNLYGNLVFENNGILNIANTKSIIVSSVPTSITTLNNGQGTVNFEGTTNLYTSIGTENFKLNNVTFASTGNTSNIYNQDIDKNVYALNTYIGNGSNKTTLNIKEDITFGGNLNLRKDSVLNVSDYNVTVDNNLNIASNSTLNFKVNATDLEGLASSTYGNYGSINSTSLTIDNDSEIHISYVGTLNGTDTYDLIRTSNIILTNYEGTELNGLVSDDSIVNSIVKNVGNNLVLFVDRTGGGSFAAEDLYIEKSGIGKDYSNGASRSLAGYAKEQDRAGALTDIVRKMEYFEGGTDVSEAKKQEMIEIQRLLAPTANNSNIQSTITATNLSASTIKGRLSDIRVTQENNFTPNTYDYLGLSSGDYYTFDTSFWLKAMASKATQDRIKEYDGFDTSTYGFVGGMDKITNDGTIFGVALSYSTTKTKQDGLRTDDSDTTSVQATLYSSQEIGDAYVDGYLSYGKHKTDATRTANSGKLNSSVNSDQISAKVETGYKIPLNDGISLTPFASLEYSLLNQKGYTEKGSTYQNDALKVDSIKLNRGTAELGAKLVTNIEFDDTLIIPQFSASVYNSFGDNKPDVKAQFVGGGNKFVTPVSDMNDTMFNLGLGVETKISDSTSLIFDVDYDRSKDGKFEAYSGSVTFGVSF